MKYEENIPLQIIKLSLGWDRCYLYVCVGGGGEGGDRVGHLVLSSLFIALSHIKGPYNLNNQGMEHKTNCSCVNGRKDKCFFPLL